MKNIKYIALALCALMVMALTGCTSEPADKDTSLQDVLDAGKIVWGTNAEFTPFEYVDGAGNVVGVDAEIAQAIADELGVELVVENILFDSLPAALEGGSIDFIGAGFTVNEERLQKMDFTDTYFIAKQVVVVKAGDTAIAAEEDLVGKKIGVQTGTTGDLFIASEIEGAEVCAYDSMLQAAQDLLNGRVDCVIGDDLPMAMILDSLGGLEVVETITYADEEYAMAVKKGDTALLEAINAVIKNLKESGAIDEMVSRHS